MEIKWITADVLAPNINWLKQKGKWIGSKTWTLEEGQASGLVSLSSALCGFLLSLQPHQTSHQHITTSRRRGRAAGSSCSFVLSMRRPLPEAPGKPAFGVSLARTAGPLPKPSFRPSTRQNWLMLCPPWVPHGQSRGPPWSCRQVLNSVTWGADRMHDMEITLLATLLVFTGNR